MQRQLLTKTDGHSLLLYTHEWAPDGRCAPSPESAAQSRNSHLRWHPLRGEWVAYAEHRQHRTFQPPPQHNSLAPSCERDDTNGTWDVAVFENLVPTLSGGALDASARHVDTAAGRGVCEVVVFTQDPAASFGSLPLWHVELIVDVWAARDRGSNAGLRSELACAANKESLEPGAT